MEEKKETEPQLRGLYRHVNIPVRTLNIIIVALSALLVICIIIGISRGGYQITFNTLGGTAVESQRHMYGELVEEPVPPTREGYVFDGWYHDEALTIPWDIENDIVMESMTLYAGWKTK